MYRNYEEYMQSVLGYNAPNTYREAENYYYNTMRVNRNMQEINSLYPEIYGIIYPVVQKVCSRKNFFNISREQIEQMVEEVYNVVEPIEEETDIRENLKNGDVRNPRVKEMRKPRQNNYVLRDLIKILIIRELLSGKSGMSIPLRPNQGEMGNMPPIMRPRKSNDVLKSYYQLANLRFFLFSRKFKSSTNKLKKNFICLRNIKTP